MKGGKKPHNPVSVDAEIAFDKIQHPFRIQVCEELAIGGSLLICCIWKSHSQNHAHLWNTEIIFPKIQVRDTCSHYLCSNKKIKEQNHLRADGMIDRMKETQRFHATPPKKTC